jgi:hypothetical protein
MPFVIKWILYTQFGEKTNLFNLLTKKNSRQRTAVLPELV